MASPYSQAPGSFSIADMFHIQQLLHWSMDNSCSLREHFTRPFQNMDMDMPWYVRQRCCHCKWSAKCNAPSITIPGTNQSLNRMHHPIAIMSSLDDVDRYSPFYEHPRVASISRSIPWQIGWHSSWWIIIIHCPDCNPLTDATQWWFIVYTPHEI